MSDPNETLQEHIARAIDPDRPQPPYPTSDHHTVKALAKDLNGMAFGEQDWHQNFRTADQFYGNLAQAILNSLQGWVFDISNRTWVTKEDLAGRDVPPVG